ncbi:DUF1700 domain-containing protein [[Clostridium] hylemonae]|uniref:DUF1700 domain-containing protein n=1 Tax=[Clostridium] hylemonae TaxID=89153 RepID=UPI0011066FE0|nr:DUF1700 domain-containing protein [[Clostridium] hylemonae]
MNRIEFMTELAALLQNVPVEERREAMQYYNDYFDDAGEENEQRVIEELGSPAKVAGTIKAGLSGDDGAQGEFSETGYRDTRFERRDVPAGREGYRYGDEEPPRTNRTLKIILIVAIIIVGAPVVIPLAVGISAAVFACVAASFLFFLALVIASIAVAIAGISLLCIGIANLVPALAVGMALVGTGLLLAVLGAIATVGTIRLCIIVYPGIIRGIVWILRRPFQGKVVA